MLVPTRTIRLSKAVSICCPMADEATSVALAGNVAINTQRGTEDTTSVSVCIKPIV